WLVMGHVMGHQVRHCYALTGSMTETIGAFYPATQNGESVPRSTTFCAASSVLPEPSPTF
ncbi:MAG: hypothetical protein RBT67_16385, partial [Thauera sp.]|nr:hypothetical protein [Thauera sp.]